jgi:O-antigen/teichoic acid export membrane protein
LLGSLAGPAAVGLFRVAMFPVLLASVTSAPIRMLLLPEQAKLAAERRFEDVWRSIRVHTLAGLSIGVPSAVAGYFVLDWLIPLLFSESFSSAVDAARILLVAAVGYLALGWWRTLPAAVGKPQIRTIIAAVSLILTLGLLALLGSAGSEGAALAVSLEAVIDGALLLFFARRLLVKAARTERRPVVAESSR